LPAQGKPDGGGLVSGDGSRIRPRAESNDNAAWTAEKGYPRSNPQFPPFNRAMFAPACVVDATRGRLMSLIVVFLIILFPILVLAAAASLGVGTLAFLCAPTSNTKTGSQLARWFNGSDRFSVALMLASSITVVAAAAVLIPRIADFKNLYGEFLEHLWLWATGAFSIGLIFGWGSCRQVDDP
jgi:hypothetical protein